jgi:hypothetical protein
MTTTNTIKKFDVDAARNSAKSAIESGRLQGFSSDASADFIARQLEMLDSQFYKYPLPELEMTNLLSPKDVGAGFSSYKYIKYGIYGKMGTAPVSDTVNEAYPIIESDTLPLFWHKIKVRYTTDEMRKAEQSTVPLEEWYLYAGRTTLLQGMERIWALGNTELRLEGLFKPSGSAFNTYSVSTDGTGTVSTNWFGPTSALPTGFVACKSGAAIAQDVQNFIRTAGHNTFWTHKIDTVVMPYDHLELLKITPWTVSSPLSVWEVITKQNPGVKFVGSRWLFDAGDSGKARLFGFQNDPMIVQRVQGLAPTLLAAQYSGFNIEIPMECYSGGVAMRFPKSCVIADGI